MTPNFQLKIKNQKWLYIDSIQLRNEFDIFLDLQILMLNYNKSYRQNSSQKPRSRSIYGGNKSHTTSMNIKVCPDITLSDFSNIPLKTLINKNEQRKQQQKYKFTKEQPRQVLKSDNKQNSIKSKSNKRIKPFNDDPTNKVSQRGSFIEKQGTLIHKNSVIALQTQRYSRQKSWKRLDEKNQKSHKKQSSQSRIKTDCLISNQENNFDQIHLNNIYSQMVHQRQQSNHQAQLYQGNSKSINLFNVKKDEAFIPLLSSANESSQTISINVEQLKFFMKSFNDLKNHREALRKQLNFYKGISKKQQIKNSVYQALR